MRGQKGRTARIVEVVLVVVVVVVFFVSPRVATAEPTTQELLDKITAMQAEIDQLKSQQRQQPQPQQATPDADDTQTTRTAVMEDAQRRSQILDSDTLQAGYAENRFFLRAADGNFSLRPSFHFQARNVTSYRDDPAGDATADDFQNGFEIRRLKFGFDGNAFGPDITYYFLWATNRTSGSPELEEGWAKFMRKDSHFGLRIGQIKNPFYHEQIVSSKYQLAVERSLPTQLFANGDGIVQGISGIYDPAGPFRAEVALTDGMRSFNTNFQDFPATTSGNSPQTNWGAVARAEYKLFGNWKEYDRLSSQGNKDELFVIGAGMDYSEAGDTGTLSHVVDAQYALPNNVLLYSAYIGRFVSGNQGPPATSGGSTDPTPGADTYDFALVGQIGYMIDPKWEPFIRYDFIRFDADSIPADATQDVHEITVGVNYYLHGHGAKFTLDASYLPNGSPVSDTGSGVLATDGNSDEFVFRAQFQLLL